MLTELEIRSEGPLTPLARAVGRVRNAFPDLRVKPVRTPVFTGTTEIAAAPPLAVVPASVWRAPTFDPLSLDDAVADVLRESTDFALRLIEEPEAVGDLSLTALQVVTRCQRHLTGRNRHSWGELFDAILQCHRSLHDLAKPLVAADYDHALDTWRWVLRLEPHAPLALQVAALFHDVERLVTESEARVEQHAPDYATFKRAHAAAGAAMTGSALKNVGAPAALIERVVALVAGHEVPDGDPDRATLNEADALSFFSLNAPGFARYYGPEHTAKKVAYTLDRLGPRGRIALAVIRHRADIAALIEARDPTKEVA